MTYIYYIFKHGTMAKQKAGTVHGETMDVAFNLALSHNKIEVKALHDKDDPMAWPEYGYFMGEIRVDVFISRPAKHC